MEDGVNKASVVRTIDARGVARVEIARERIRNALDESTIEALYTAFAELADDGSVRVLVLAGRGRAFCAGADLQWMRRSAGMGVDENVADAERFAAMLEEFARFPRPTVAKVQGAAYGGGLGLVAAADMAIAGASAKFALSEVRLGLEPAMIAPYVVEAIGSREFRHRALTGTPFDASEALQLGLVSKISNESHLESAVEHVVEALLAGGPEAQRHIKELAIAVAGRARDRSLRRELAGRIAARRSSAEGQEGAAAFLERRSPEWTA